MFRTTLDSRLARREAESRVCRGRGNDEFETVVTKHLAR